MKRWNTSKPLSYIKRGVTSLFVCAAVILPIVTMVQWGHAFARPSDGPKDTRTTTLLPELQPRAIDKGVPNLFGEPIISVTFDDGWESVYPDAMPLLNKYGIRTTQYIMSATTGDVRYFSDFQLREILRTGHELDAHTATHADIATLDAAGSQRELVESQRSLRQRLPGAKFDDFASPYGSTNDASMAIIRQQYRSHRNVNGDYFNGVSQYDVNLAGYFDRYNIIGVTVRHDTTVADLKQLVDYTVAHNGWLVLNYHAIDDDAKYAVDKKSIEAQLGYLSGTPVRIATMGQVLDTLTLESQEY